MTVLVAVYRDRETAEAVAHELSSVPDVSLEAVRVSDAADRLLSVRAEMDAEVAESWGSPGLGAFVTAEMMRGAVLLALLIGAIGVLVGLPIGYFLFVGDASVWEKLGLGALVGGLFGATVGGLLGGGFAMQSPEEKLAAERGVPVALGGCTARGGRSDGALPTHPSRQVRRRRAGGHAADGGPRRRHGDGRGVRREHERSATTGFMSACRESRRNHDGRRTRPGSATHWRKCTRCTLSRMRSILRPASTRASRSKTRMETPTSSSSRTSDREVSAAVASGLTRTHPHSRPHPAPTSRSRPGHPGGELPGATVWPGVELDVSDRARDSSGFWSDGVFEPSVPLPHPATSPSIAIPRTTAVRSRDLPGVLDECMAVLFPPVAPLNHRVMSAVRFYAPQTWHSLCATVTHAPSVVAHADDRARRREPRAARSPRSRLDHLRTR